MSTTAQLESMLFVASRPLELKKIMSVLKISESDVMAAIEELKKKYSGESGVLLLENSNEWQLVSNPAYKETAEKFVKAEIAGELTRAQLETLTIISYLGPITKPELEQLRGVNCALILRNLLIRGLVKENDTGGLLPTYEVTMEYVRHLGLQSLKDLPDYATLHEHPFAVGARKSETA